MRTRMRLLIFISMVFLCFSAYAMPPTDAGITKYSQSVESDFTSIKTESFKNAVFDVGNMAAYSKSKNRLNKSNNDNSANAEHRDTAGLDYLPKRMLVNYSAGDMFATVYFYSPKMDPLISA